MTSTHHGHAWKYSNTKNKYLKYHENNNHSASCTSSTVFCIKDVINRRIFAKILLSYQPSITVRVTTFKTPGETDRCPQCHLTDTPILRSIRQKPAARVTVIKGTQLHILTQCVFTHRNSITITQWKPKYYNDWSHTYWRQQFYWKYASRNLASTLFIRRRLVFEFYQRY